MNSTIERLKQLPYTHWTEGVNTDTTQAGYFIEYAGSLWLGQPNTQNTIEEILSLSHMYGFRPGFCSLSRKKTQTFRRFSGNMEHISNAFSVIIWNERVANKIRRALLKQGTRINKR